MKRKTIISPIVLALIMSSLCGPGLVYSGGGKKEKKSEHGDLPSHAELTAALKTVVDVGENAGFGLNMWATIVNRDGEVCTVTFSGDDRGDQWPGSRAISAQKANTANAFSLPGLALSTSNLYSAVQPGGSLFGLQESNPVDPAVAYKGPAKNFGQANDPMVGKRIGGVNVFGGGLALYNSDGELVGAIGVSGDTSCTDHIIAWKVRDALDLDYVPAGVAPGAVAIPGQTTDNAVYDITFIPDDHPVSASGWGHPDCGTGNGCEQSVIAVDLPNSNPIGIVSQ
jgi:uncharacterized protein GlcG (DUF336 family)